MLQDARRCRSAKVTINATSWLHLPDTTVCTCENITRDDNACLVLSNRECFAHLLTHFLLFQQQIFFVLVCIHPGNPRVPPWVLASGPKPCRGKNLNEHVQYHFKMDTLQSAYGFMKRNCCRALVDLRDAYYSMPIDEKC